MHTAFAACDAPIVKRLPPRLEVHPFGNWPKSDQSPRRSYRVNSHLFPTRHSANSTEFNILIRPRPLIRAFANIHAQTALRRSGDPKNLRISYQTLSNGARPHAVVTKYKNVEVRPFPQLEERSGAKDCSVASVSSASSIPDWLPKIGRVSCHPATWSNGAYALKQRLCALRCLLLLAFERAIKSAVIPAGRTNENRPSPPSTTPCDASANSLRLNYRAKSVISIIFAKTRPMRGNSPLRPLSSSGPPVCICKPLRE